MTSESVASGEDAIMTALARTDDITVNVPASADVSGPPRVTFESAIRDFAMDVLAEASRRETAVRGSSSAHVQYISAYFEAAKVYVRELGYVPKRPWWYVPSRIFAPIAFLLAGITIPVAVAKDAWVGWAFISGGTVVVAVVLSIIVETKIGRGAN